MAADLGRLAARHDIEAFQDTHAVIFEGGKEKMNDRRAENYIPGSSLSARRSSVLIYDELRFWLKCWND